MRWYLALFFVAAVFVCVSCGSAFLASPDFGGTTPANNSNATQPVRITVNLGSVNSNEEAYGFINFNRSVVAWLRFEDLSASNTTTDSSGRGNTATLFYNATLNYTNKRFGNSSLNLVDISSRAHARMSSSVSREMDPVNGFSVSFWYYPIYNSPGGTIFGSLTGNNGTYFAIDNTTSASGNRINQHFGQPSGTIGNFPLVIGANDTTWGIRPSQWNHLVFVYFRGSTKFYINGRLSGSGAFPDVGAPCIGIVTCINNSNYFFFIGSVQSFGLPLGIQGQLDEFIMFNYPLQEQEISGLYGGAGLANLTRDIYLKTNSTYNYTGFLVNSSGAVVSTSNRTINAFNSGPFFFQYNSTWESSRNRSSSSVFTTSSFYGSPDTALFNNTNLIANVSYRTSSTGSWQALNSPSYVSWSSQNWGGTFGDSIMTGWPRELDALIGTFIWGNSSIMRAVGGYRCYQVLTLLNESVRNNTNILFNCGVNDANDPLQNINDTLGNITAFLQLAYQKNLSVYMVGVTPHQNTSICDRISTINSFMQSYYLNNNTGDFIKGYADVYNTTLKSQSDCGFNQTYFADTVHPNEMGRIVLANEVYRQAFHGLRYDGWTHSFTPTQNGTYDLNWTVSTPTGESNSYTFLNLFDFYVPQSNISDESNSSSDSSDSDSSSRASYRPESYSIPPVSLDSGYQNLLYVRDSLKFVVSGQEHTLTLNSFNADKAEVILRSTPVKLILRKGESKDVDIDSDGSDDISVLYNGIVNSHASIYLQTVVNREEIITPEPIAQDASNVGFEGRRMVLIFGALGILVAGIIVLIVYRFKNRHNR